MAVPSQQQGLPATSPLGTGAVVMPSTSHGVIQATPPAALQPLQCPSVAATSMAGASAIAAAVVTPTHGAMQVACLHLTHCIPLGNHAAVHLPFPCLHPLFKPPAICRLWHQCCLCCAAAADFAHYVSHGRHGTGSAAAAVAGVNCSAGGEDLARIRCASGRSLPLRAWPHATHVTRGHCHSQLATHRSLDT